MKSNKLRVSVMLFFTFIFFCNNIYSMEKIPLFVNFIDGDAVDVEHTKILQSEKNRRTLLDLSDKNQYAFLVNRLQMSGKNRGNSPFLFSIIDETKEHHIDIAELSASPHSKNEVSEASIQSVSAQEFT